MERPPSRRIPKPSEFIDSCFRDFGRLDSIRMLRVDSRNKALTFCLSREKNVDQYNPDKISLDGVDFKGDLTICLLIFRRNSVRGIIWGKRDANDEVSGLFGSDS
jgi:hypothetical protein